MDSRAASRARRAGRSAVWLTIAAAFVTPLAAYFSELVHPLVAFAVAALGILAVWKTGNAVLVVAAIGPISPTIHAMLKAPYDGQGLFEASVLAVLAGAAVRAASRGVPLQPTVFEAALLAFMLVVAASCVVQMPILLLKTGTSETSAALRIFTFREYFERWPMFVGVERGVVLIEGAALAAVIGRLFRPSAEAARLAAMVFLGGVAAAALNVHRLAEVALRRPPFVETLWRVVMEVRFNTQYGDLNAAGSFFAMMSVLGISRLRTAAPAWVWNGAGLLVVLFGLWVSGSRVALAATVVCSSAWLLVLRFGKRMSRAVMRRAALTGAVLLIAAFVAVVVAFPQTRHTSISYSVATRIELAKVGLRMVAERPLFGVGMAQYYGQFERYVSPELDRMFRQALGKPVPRENAHNQFVQFGAELGLVGLATFILVLVAALGRPALPADERRYAAVAALAAFLITCLAGHPLLTGVVTLSFFMVVGLVASAASSAVPWRRGHAAALSALALTVVISVPLRWQLERREADLADVSVGMSAWQHDSEGLRFQWAGDRAALFVPSQLSAVRLPLRSPDAAPRRVRILLDGRPAAGVFVPPGPWHDAIVPLPPSRDVPAFRRIDLVVEGAPAGTGDAQILMVGRIGEVAR